VPYQLLHAVRKLNFIVAAGSGMLKNIDLGELAKGVISIIGLAGGALKK
jgi:hypothetical protein